MLLRTQFSKKKRDCKRRKKKHCFIFNLQPFSFYEKPFIIHLEPSVSGKGSKEIDRLIQYFINYKTKNKICFISVDGDLYYYHFFSRQFDRLFQLYKNGGIYILSNCFQLEILLYY